MIVELPWKGVSQEFAEEVNMAYQQTSGIDSAIHGNRMHDWATVLHTRSFSPTDVVLDIGCGFAYFLFMIAPRIKKGYGVDDGSFTVYGGIFSGIPDAYNAWLKTLEQQPDYNNGKIEITTQTGANLPFPDKSIDTIVTFSALEHFINDEDIGASQEAYRVLKDDGVFCGTVDFNPLTEKPLNSYGTPAVDGRTYTYDSFFKRIVEPGGWVLTGEDMRSPIPEAVDYVCRGLFFSLRKG